MVSVWIYWNSLSLSSARYWYYLNCAGSPTPISLFPYILLGPETPFKSCISPRCECVNACDKTISSYKCYALFKLTTDFKTEVSQIFTRLKYFFFPIILCWYSKLRFWLNNASDRALLCLFKFGLMTRQNSNNRFKVLVIWRMNCSLLRAYIILFRDWVNLC